MTTSYKKIEFYLFFSHLFKKIIKNFMNSNRAAFTKACIYLMALLINLVFFIAGCVILGDSSIVNSENEFYYCWISNLLLTIVSGIMFFVDVFNFYDKISIHKERDITLLDSFLILLNSGLSIWALIIYYFQIDLTKLKAEHINLFYLFESRIYYTFLFLGMFTALVMIFIGYYILKCCPEDR